MKAIIKLGERLLPIVSKKEFSWPTLPNKDEFKELLHYLQSNYDRFIEESQVKLIHNDNYHVVYQRDHINIMEMGLKKGFYYPFHDHPNMLVVSLILKGRVQIGSTNFKRTDIYDAHPRVQVGQKYTHLIRFDINPITFQVCEPRSTALLYHNFQNIHSLAALEDTVLLDVIINDYDHIDRVFTIFDQSSPATLTAVQQL